MRSSYLHPINYGEIIRAVTFLKNPKKIVEIGILDGFSLSKFVESADKECMIEAYDIFESFNGNHADYENMTSKFADKTNVKINYGNFYEIYKCFDDEYIDILHVDIANNGDILQFVVDNYMNKIKSDGIIIFEGGSAERDNVEWMIKYNKPKINPLIEKLKEKGTNIFVCGSVPSISIIKK